MTHFHGLQDHVTWASWPRKVPLYVSPAGTLTPVSSEHYQGLFCWGSQFRHRPHSRPPPACLSAQPAAPSVIRDTRLALPALASLTASVSPGLVVQWAFGLFLCQ